MDSRIGFATKLGGVLAAAGSAVGLGNIWRFPMQAGENGGGAFILIYLLCVLAVGIPLLIGEFIIGRHARANVGQAFTVLTPTSPFRYIGPLCVATAFLIYCYYNVVAGWVLDYAYNAAAGNFNVDEVTLEDGTNVFAAAFGSFVSDPLKPLACLFIFVLINHTVVSLGVQKGIERISRFLMPLLFIIMLVLIGFALMMPGAGKGLSFLFDVDFSAITPQVALSAVAQCFYSLSLGMGIVTYASYFKATDNLGSTALSVALMDTLVAVLAGIIIFPAVFSVEGIEPTAGASLVFIALPNVFNSALSSTPLLAWFMPVLFYVLLGIAAMTSCIFLHEVATAYVYEKFSMKRWKASACVSGVALALGICCSLSMGIWDQYKVCGLNLFDLFDYVTAKLMLPVSGLLISLYVGHKLKVSVLWRELTSHGRVRVLFLIPFLVMLRWVIPTVLAVILVSQLAGVI